jgi:hypothetical protein
MKKTKTYILLAVVITIWGFLLFKIYEAFFGEKDQVVYQQNQNRKKLDIKNKKETLQIEYPNRDPFLGIIYKPVPKDESKFKSKPRKKINYDSIFNTITYKGFIKSKQDSSYLYIINYKQRSLVLKPKDKFEEVIFLSGDAEEIQVKYKSVTKTIKIAN